MAANRQAVPDAESQLNLNFGLSASSGQVMFRLTVSSWAWSGL
jgi:hypothetical protein